MGCFLGSQAATCTHGHAVCSGCNTATASRGWAYACVRARACACAWVRTFPSIGRVLVLDWDVGHCPQALLAL